MVQFTLSTPLGPMIGWWSEVGLVALAFSGTAGERRARRHLARWYRGPTATGEAPAALEAWFQAWQRREPLPEVPLDLRGSEHELAVWSMLRELRFGQTTSYGAMAARLGTQAQALGRAVGDNPVAMIVPCHRVLAADGKLTGYAGGQGRKQEILAHEAQQVGLFAG